MTKLYIILGAVILGCVLMFTSFSYGRKYEKTIQTNAKIVDYRKNVDRALSIADAFLVISKDFVEKITTTREVTKTIVKEQVRYVDKYIQANPSMAACIAPDPVISLRNCQIERLRRAAGYPVSSGSPDGVCPPGLSNEP